MAKIKYTHDKQFTGFRVPEPGMPVRENRRNLIKRVFKRLKEDNVSIISAGVAFFLFLALFPGLAAIVSVYGLAVDAFEVEQQLSQVANVLPSEAYLLISDILRQVADKSTGTLGWSLIISIILSLWSANKATSAVFEGVNIAYHETDERSFFLKKAITMLFTLGAIVAGIISIAFVMAFPAFIDRLGLSPVLHATLSLLRWVILAGIICFLMGLIYRTASGKGREYRGFSPGAIFATIIWIGGSLLFTLYIDNFGAYDKTYGSIATVIILMLWFYLTGFIIMLGAQINSETLPDRHVKTMVENAEPLGLSGINSYRNFAGVNNNHHLNGHN